ncbi:MAG: nucleotidyltransferase domain-containing protein [Patescibacteria group bacterium]
MGKVYTLEQVSAGQVPSLGAHEKAASQILSGFKESEVTDRNAAALVFGSTATGKADERSDLDLLVTYSSDGEAEKALLDEVRQIVDAAALEYGVIPEFKAMPEDDVTKVVYDEDSGDSYRTDPLLATHLLDIYKSYPNMSHNNPVKEMEEIAIDLRDLSQATPEQKLTVAMLAVKYTESKVEMFRQGYVHSFVTDADGYIKIVQRALEAPKAMGRKVLAQIGTESCRTQSYDVTDKSEMQRLLQEAAEKHIGYKKGRQLQEAQTLLVNFDSEYLAILRQAIATGQVAEYEKWIRENSKEIIWAAKQMSEIWGEEMRDRLELAMKFTPSATSFADRF